MPRQTKELNEITEKELNDLLKLDNEKYGSSSDLSNEDEIAATPKNQQKTSSKVVVNPKKRPTATAFKEEPMENSVDVFSGEMHKMLECFSNDMTKNLTTKRKKLQQFTQASLKASTKKVEDFLKVQQSERQKMNEELLRQMLSILEMMVTDLQKTKEQKEKLQKSIIQQQKFLQQSHIAQDQHIKNIHQLLDQYKTGCEVLENSHEGQQGNIQNELKKELALLQKKILMESQLQMANVRKSLLTMLF